MLKITKEELTKIFSVAVDYDVTNICLDSREVQVGDLFLAFKGAKVDGHDFVNQAFNRGAALAIVEHDVKLENENFKERLIFSSSLDALKKLSSYRLKQVKAPFIGITGSVGKTTTKNMLNHLFSHIPDFSTKTYAAFRNFNTNIGLPVCVSLMPLDTKIGIFEYGVSHKGDMRDLLEILAPSMSIITNIGHTHLEFFGSSFEIAKEKAQIFETKKKQEACIIPSDSAFKDFLVSKAKENRIENIFSFGSAPNADAKILELEDFNNSIKVKAEILGRPVSFVLHCNSAFAENAIASILAAHIYSKMDARDLASIMENFTSQNKRSEVKILRDITLIDDSYNASPESMRAALMSLGKYKSTGRKVAVLGDMLELGSLSKHYHENLAATIDKFGVDVIFACGKMCRALFDNVVDSKKGSFKDDSKALALDVMSSIKEGDVILVKGSHGMQMDYISDMIYSHFKG